MANSGQTPGIELSFVDADPKFSNQAIVNTLANDAVAVLEAEGYTPKARYTTTRGNAPFDILMEVTRTFYDNRELIIELVKFATPVISALIVWHQKRSAEQPKQTPPVVIVIRIGEASVTVPTDKVQDNVWLLEQLLAADPTLPTTITPDDKLRVNVELQSPTRAH